MSIIDDDDFADRPPCLTFSNDAVVHDHGLKLKVNKANYNSPIEKKATLHTPKQQQSNYYSPSFSNVNATPLSKRKLQAPSAINPGLTQRKQKKKAPKQTQLDKDAQLKYKMAALRGSKNREAATSSHLHPNSAATNQQKQSQMHHHQHKSHKDHQPQQSIPNQYMHQHSAQMPAGYPSVQPMYYPPAQEYMAAPPPQPEEVPWFFKALGTVLDNGKKIFAPPQVVNVPKSASPVTPAVPLNILPGSLTPEISAGGFSANPELYQHSMMQQQNQFPVQNYYYPYTQPSGYPPNNYYVDGTQAWKGGYTEDAGYGMPSPGKVGFSYDEMQEVGPEGFPSPLLSHRSVTPKPVQMPIPRPSGNASFFDAFSSTIHVILMPLAILVLSITALAVTDVTEPSSNLVQQMAGFLNNIIRSGAIITMFCSALFILYKYLALTKTTSIRKSSTPKPVDNEIYFAGQSLDNDPFYWHTIQEAQEIARNEMQKLNRHNSNSRRYGLLSPIEATPYNNYAEPYPSQQMMAPPMMPYYMQPNNYVFQAQPYQTNPYIPYSNPTYGQTYDQYGLPTPIIQYPESELGEEIPVKSSKQNKPKGTPVVLNKGVNFATPQIGKPSPQSEGTSPIFGGLFNLPSPMPPSAQQQQPTPIPGAIPGAFSANAAPGYNMTTPLPAQPQPPFVSGTSAGKTSMEEYLSNMGILSGENNDSKSVNPVPPATGGYPPGNMTANYVVDPMVLSSNKGYVHHFSFLPAGSKLDENDDTLDPLFEKKHKKLHVLDLAENKDFRKEILQEMEAPGNGMFLSMPPVPNVDDHTTEMKLPKELFNLSSSIKSNPYLSGYHYNYPNIPSRTSSVAPSVLLPPSANRGVFGTPFNNMEYSLLEAALDKASKKKESKDEKAKKEKEKKKKEEEEKNKLPIIEDKYYVDGYSCKPYGPPPKRYRAVKV